ncbi:MAG: cytochrome C oxidase subunit IV family protein [Chromatiales bacterium]|nr:cytochrome C oxidase subunit IV family protein [Chromatiales bacterium]
MHKAKDLNLVWIALILLTAASALIAEYSGPSAAIVLFVGAITCAKGSLVIDRFMGLRSAPPVVRWAMLSYFVVFPGLIVIFSLFTDTAGQ